MQAEQIALGIPGQNDKTILTDRGLVPLDAAAGARPCVCHVFNLTDYLCHFFVSQHGSDFERKHVGRPAPL